MITQLGKRAARYRAENMSPSSPVFCVALSTDPTLQEHDTLRCHTVPGCARCRTLKEIHAFGEAPDKKEYQKERRERRKVVGTELYQVKGSVSQCGNYSIINM